MKLFVFVLVAFGCWAAAVPTSKDIAKKETISNGTKLTNIKEEPLVPKKTIKKEVKLKDAKLTHIKEEPLVPKKIVKKETKLKNINFTDVKEEPLAPKKVVKKEAIFEDTKLMDPKGNPRIESEAGNADLNRQKKAIQVCIDVDDENKICDINGQQLNPSNSGDPYQFQIGPQYQSPQQAPVQFQYHSTEDDSPAQYQPQIFASYSQEPATYISSAPSYRVSQEQLAPEVASNQPSPRPYESQSAPISNAARSISWGSQPLSASDESSDSGLQYEGSNVAENINELNSGFNKRNSETIRNDYSGTKELYPLHITTRSMQPIKCQVHSFEQPTESFMSVPIMNPEQMSFKRSRSADESRYNGFSYGRTVNNPQMLRLQQYERTGRKADDGENNLFGLYEVKHQERRGLNWQNGAQQSQIADGSYSRYPYSYPTNYLNPSYQIGGQAPIRPPFFNPYVQPQPNQGFINNPAQAPIGLPFSNPTPYPQTHSEFINYPGQAPVRPPFLNPTPQPQMHPGYINNWGPASNNYNPQYQYPFGAQAQFPRPIFGRQGPRLDSSGQQRSALSSPVNPPVGSSFQLEQQNLAQPSFINPSANVRLQSEQQQSVLSSPVNPSANVRLQSEQQQFVLSSPVNTQTGPSFPPGRQYNVLSSPVNTPTGQSVPSGRPYNVVSSSVSTPTGPSFPLGRQYNVLSSQVNTQTGASSGQQNSALSSSINAPAGMRFQSEQLLQDGETQSHEPLESLRWQYDQGQPYSIDSLTSLASQMAPLYNGRYNRANVPYSQTRLSREPKTTEDKLELAKGAKESSVEEIKPDVRSSPAGPVSKA